jgi:D-cysteine desulfhydrase family pyridoxal phosphate-dependent enzyme
MPAYSLSELKENISAFPTTVLIRRPTPFYKLENLSQALGGPAIYIKRDDLTGLAFGGNKSRKLEFIMQDILNKGADTVVTWAALQSNWCLQTAAAAKKLGITPVLVLFKTYDLPEEYDGNLLLDVILGADIRIKEAEKEKILTEAEAEGFVEEIIIELRQNGRRPYFAPLGGSKVGGSMDRPLGAISYVQAYLEMEDQARDQNVVVDCVILASGSGGTQAGLTVGASAFDDKTRVLGVSVSEEKSAYSERVRTIVTDTVDALNLNIRVENEQVRVLDEYLREGYGIVNREVSEAIRLVAEKEGIFLDPVYTGKAMVALMDLVKKGYFRRDENVVFFHTGGTAALFPNKHNLLKWIGTGEQE